MTATAGTRSRSHSIAQAAAGRPDLISIIERLPRFARREAYHWREGVRWRTRSYGELQARVHSCAAALTGHGVGAGDAVLIQGPETADWVEALLGTLLAGAAAVPLDGGSPADFRDKVARKVGARLLVAGPGIDPPAGVSRLPFGSWGAAGGARPGGRPGAAGAAPAAPPARPGPDDRAASIFTSGTTGDPKGVVLTHGNLASDFAPILDVYLRRERAIRAAGRVRMLSTLPLSHMFGQTMNVFLSLFMGLTVVFVPARPREVIDAARRKRAWGLFTVPRLLELLAAEVRRGVAEDEAPERFEARLERLASWPFYLQMLAFPRVRRLFGWRFRLIVSGGAALPEPVQQFFERCGYLVIQGYGLTETSPVVSISNPFERRAGSVGRPLAIQEIRLGPDGEIWVRGPNVTPGYLGAGQEAFQDGWFRTGDIGELDAEGRLRIRGRIKDVIVTPEGENVHPGDVEAALRALSGVREASVFGMPRGGGERVHAALVLQKGAEAEAIVTLANERLEPRQRIRGHTVWPEDDFPRTATGKVRKGVLRDRILEMERAGTPEAVAAPAAGGGVRRLIAGLTRSRPESLRDDTRLVEGLGLGSLDLVELAVAIESEYGVSVPEEILAGATVADLERLAAGAAPGGAFAAEAGRPPGAPAPAGGVAPGGAGARGPGAPGAEPEAPGPGAPKMPRWAIRTPVRLARRLVEEVAFRAVVLTYARPTVTGLEHLRVASPPFLFVANHHSYMDTGLFKVTLPARLRGRIAPGMTTRYHRVFFGETPGSAARYALEWLQVRLVEFFFNTWPLPETAGFRQSLLYAGELMDAGWSILIFPEGRHVPEGRIEPFRRGIGIFARELRAPVIPGYVEGTGRVLPDGARWPRFGRTLLALGAPLVIDPAEPAEAITRRLEDAVRALAPRALAQNGSPSTGSPSSPSGGGGGT
jgi:long-chain acyl-CoA synthetase